MKFTICHDTSKKTLAIPRAALQLSGLEDAERLTLHTEYGCIVLTRQEPSAAELLSAVHLLHDRAVHFITLLALKSHGAKELPPSKLRNPLQRYDSAYLFMLEHCGVELDRLGCLLSQEANKHG